MKIVIELDDHDLHKAVAEQVSKQVAAVSSEYIMGKVNEILNIKFGRLDSAAVERFVMEAARQEVRAVTGRGFNDSVVKEALASASLKLLKERV